MARSHHRKKHKEHLRSYQHSQGSLTGKPKKTKVTAIFTVLGAATGFAIGFFAVGNTIAMVIGAVAGSIIGYFIGRRVDEQAEK